MHILWKLKKAFVKDVLAEITEDQPHYNTLSTIIRNLEEKGFVGHNAYGQHASVFSCCNYGRL
jgi:BlaI family penicillinase repressor